MAVNRETVERLSELLDLYHYIQPVNSGGERERFLDAVEDGEEYNPTYRYRDFPDEDEVLQLLGKLGSAADTSLEQGMAASLRGKFEMMQAIGSGEITSLSRQHYGSPDRETVEEARRKFSPPKKSGERVVRGKLVKEMFEALFEELDIGYGCEHADVDIIRNSPGERRILVPREKEYTRQGAKRLLVHETTHSVRTVNGVERGEAPLIYGTEGFELAEEGLATFNEYEFGVFQDTLPRITARVLAVASSDKDFHGIYQEMRELGLDRRTAFVRVYRVKRGLEDTSLPGGFIKDHIYFKGYSLLTESPGLADRLYAGKIGVDDVDSAEVSPRTTREEHLEACEKVARDLLP